MTITNNQPARCPHCGYTQDAIPSGSDAYAQANCEHRESHAEPAPAPLPGDDGVMCARLLFACTGHPHALIPWPHRLLHDAVAHISDLTRRLAEAEAELAARTRLASNAQDALRHARAEILSRFTHMEFADRQADANIWVYDLEALCSGLEYQLIRAAAAEARVRELEEQITASKRNERRWIAKGEEAIAERNAANKALEAIKRHQEIVAGTGTAQMSTTWKIADGHLRSRGAALAATEKK